MLGKVQVINFGGLPMELMDFLGGTSRLICHIAWLIQLRGERNDAPSTFSFPVLPPERVSTKQQMKNATRSI